MMTQYFYASYYNRNICQILYRKRILFLSHFLFDKKKSNLLQVIHICDFFNNKKRAFFIYRSYCVIVRNLSNSNICMKKILRIFVKYLL